MFKVLCKIWTFILKVFRMVLDGVVEALGLVLKAISSILGQIWDTVGGDGLGFKTILLLAGLGLAGYWLYGVYAEKKEKEEEQDFRKSSLALQYAGATI